MCKLKIFRKYPWFVFDYFNVFSIVFRQRNLRNSAKSFGRPAKSHQIQRKSSVVLTKTLIPAEFWRNHGMNALGPEDAIARLMHVGASGWKTHDGARRCMQDSWWGQRMHARPPCEARDPAALFMQGARAACNTGGPRLYVYMYMNIDYIRHEHRLPQTWTSYTHIRHEHRTSDMDIEHQTWTWTSDMNIEHQTWTSNIEHRHCMYIRHEHRTSDMNIEHQTNVHAWVSWTMQVHVCRVHAHLCMHACMHNHECMHTHGWSGHCPCMHSYAFRPHELIPGCIMELHS